MRSPRGARGVIFLDFVIGLAMTATLSLVVAYMFKSASTSWQISTKENTILTNARKALNGDAATRGLTLEIQYAANVTTATLGSLSLTDFSGVTTTFTVSAAGDLVATKQGVAKTRATGLSSFQVRYYALDDTYSVVENTGPATIDLVTVQFAMTRLGKTVNFFGGARMRNQL